MKKLIISDIISTRPVHLIGRLLKIVLSFSFLGSCPFFMCKKHWRQFCARTIIHFPYSNFYHMTNLVLIFFKNLFGRLMPFLQKIITIFPTRNAYCWVQIISEIRVMLLLKYQLLLWAVFHVLVVSLIDTCQCLGLLMKDQYECCCTSFQKCRKIGEITKLKLLVWKLMQTFYYKR